METAPFQHKFDRAFATDNVAQFVARRNTAGLAPRLLECWQAAARTDLVQTLVTVVTQRTVVFEIGFGVAQVEFGDAHVRIYIIHIRIYCVVTTRIEFGFRLFVDPLLAEIAVVGLILVVVATSEALRFAFAGFYGHLATVETVCAAIVTHRCVETRFFVEMQVHCTGLFIVRVRIDVFRFGVVLPWQTIFGVIHFDRFNGRT